MCFFCLLHAALALVYSGEAATAIESNADLSYTVPKEGSNLWIDSWFIPADSTQGKRRKVSGFSVPRGRRHAQF